MPYLEVGVIPSTLRAGLQQAEGAVAAWHLIVDDEVARETRIATFVCPSTTDWGEVAGRRDYFGVTGGAADQSRPPDRQPITTGTRGKVFTNGLFQMKIEVPIQRVTDGTSSTFAVGESVHPAYFGGPPGWPGYGVAGEGGPGMWWHGGGCSKTFDPSLPSANNGTSVGRFLRPAWYPINFNLMPGMRPNQENDAPFGSDHTGGAQFVFADAHVSFIQDSVDIDVYRALSTFAGQEVVPGEGR
jgi:prepilin-type processing-associated H-X9-DG protein